MVVLSKILGLFLGVQEEVLPQNLVSMHSTPKWLANLDGQSAKNQELNISQKKTSQAHCNHLAILFVADIIITP